MLVTDAVYCAELSRLTLMARRGAIFARARQSQQGRADDEVSSGETIEHNHLHVGRVGSICFLSGSIFELIFLNYLCAERRPQKRVSHSRGRRREGTCVVLKGANKQGTSTFSSILILLYV